MKVITFLALSMLAASALAAQDTTRIAVDSMAVHQAPLYRNPHRARVLGSFIPGAGHIYAGEYLRGYLTWVVTIGGIGMGPVIFQMNRCTFALFNPSCKPGPQWPYQLEGSILVVGGIWTWIASARDASHAAERANLRHSSRKPTLTPVVEPSRTGTGQWNAGVTISW